MSTANAGIISLLRHYTTGTEEKTKQRGYYTHDYTFANLLSHINPSPLFPHQQWRSWSRISSVQASFQPFTDPQRFYTSCSCWYAPKSHSKKISQMQREKQRKKERKICMFTNSPKKREPNWGREVFFFLSCVVNDMYRCGPILVSTRLVQKANG